MSLVGEERTMWWCWRRDMKGDIRRESETLSFCAVLHFLFALRYSSSSKHLFFLWMSPCQGYSRADWCWWCSHMQLTYIPKLGSHRHGHSQTNHIPVYNYASSRSGIVLIKQTTLDNQSVLPSKHNISSNDTLCIFPSLTQIYNMSSSESGEFSIWPPCSGLSYWWKLTYMKNPDILGWTRTYHFPPTSTQINRPSLISSTTIFSLHRSSGLMMISYLQSQYLVQLCLLSKPEYFII